MGSVGIRAQSTWTGTGNLEFLGVADPLNWSGGTPLLDGTADLIFGKPPSTPQTVLIPVPFAVRNITFNGTVRPTYTFVGPLTPTTLTLNGNVTVQTSGTVFFEDSLSLDLSTGSHTVSITSGATVQVSGMIGGPGSVAKTGTGILSFAGANNYTGDLTAGAGTVILNGSAATNIGESTWAFSGASVLKVNSTSAGIGGGTFNFVNGSQINAHVGQSVTGGTLTFSDGASFQATAPELASDEDGVISGGTQYFMNSSLLKAGVTSSISGGTQFFSNTAVLTASGDHAITGGTQNFETSLSLFESTPFNLNLTSRLVVNGGGSNGISGGTQNFRGYSSLQANRSIAITGGTQYFYDYSHLRASVAGAVSGGSPHFTDSAYLWASATGAVKDVTINLRQDSYIRVAATDALTTTANIQFDGSDDGHGGSLRLGGFSTTVGTINSVGGPAGLIENGSNLHSATLTVGSNNNSSFGGVIQDGEGLPLSLVKGGDGTLTLSGNNTFTGDFYVGRGGVYLYDNHAAGFGNLELGNTAWVSFRTLAPVIYGLSADNSNDEVSLLSGSTLTINQALGNNTVFAGRFDAGNASIVKDGGGTLTFASSNLYSGTTTLSGGTLVAGANGALGTSTIVFNGGKLDVANGVTLSNTINLSGGGVLGGSGTFSTPITAGLNVVLAPGDSPGNLTFSAGLTLASGSAISFQVQDANGPAGVGYDLITVSGGILSLTATTNTITFNLLSLNGLGAPGNVANFNSGATYSWTFATAPGSIITGFNPNQFVFVNGFTNSLGGGSFSFSESLDQHSLLLNFTPVPEPSTWMLMGTALLALGFRLRRRPA